jgi:hypothetical protein
VRGSPEAAATPRSATPDRARWRRAWRWAVLGTVAVGWIVTLLRMWDAFWTLPSAELMERQRPVRPPTMGSLAAGISRSVAELGFFVLAAWPRWRPAYGLRAAGAGTAVLFYFVATVPPVITSVERVQRQWLLGSALLLLLGGVVDAVGAGIERLRDRPAGKNAG